MSISFRGVLLSVVITCLTLFHPTASAAKACKGMSKSACSGNANCSWVKSYTTKTGAKVNAYCRTTSGKKSSSQSTSSKQKKSKTSDKSVKKDKKNKSNSDKKKQSKSSNKVTDKKKKESKKDKKKKKEKKSSKSSKS
ncbi:MAG: chromosome partitioning protein ParB [Candidatus Thiodiazotropha lotti]|nr:chromosome partitioning protein ParB [Candidatus Thiodiazotropha lotti]MCG7930529.1 chromosome partitioning protein ParB [Candidatus Thiodiazotropha lotti]MCG7984921.1 chromosome partitioning protein ParB [Candidatus Thiodiazotropha lotti]MCG8004875.1 chromosome partitioning protein ParB [Candidatus Thiodiazotropha lotti]MCG8006840.1 chromosome partitioning protein ParB [Candidatus Thiodiazotropha lotti]